MHVRPQDVIARVEEDHDTELTRLAEQSTQSGVNEVLSGEKSRDGDFKIKKANAQDQSHQKNSARKKKKAQRQNRKSGRK